MDTLLAAISAWPVIIQGALGSALFWIVLTLGQNLVEVLLKFFSSKNRNLKISYLITNFIKYNSMLSESYSHDSVFMTILIFRAFGTLIKGLIWLILGLMMGLVFEPLKPILGIVGYSGCIYYLFSVLRIVSPIMPPPSPEEARKAIEEIKVESKKYKELQGFSELE